MSQVLKEKVEFVPNINFKAGIKFDLKIFQAIYNILIFRSIFRLSNAIESNLSELLERYQSTM